MPLPLPMRTLPSGSTKTAMAVVAHKPFDAADRRYKVQHADARVVVHGDQPVSDKLVDRIANETRQSLDYSIRELGWTRVPEVRAPVHIYLTSSALLLEFGLNVGGGVAYNARDFVMSRFEGRTSPEYRQNTEGHEGLHVLQYRLGSADWGPAYFYEGLASVMANRSVAARVARVEFLAGEADQIVRWTPQQAQKVMRKFRGPNPFAEFPDDSAFGGWGAEVMGALAVEFFRLRYGKPGAPPYQQLGALSLDLQKGFTYDQAFRRQLGVSAQQAENAFVAFMAATLNNPKERLAGTVWEGYASGKGARTKG